MDCAIKSSGGRKFYVAETGQEAERNFVLLLFLFLWGSALLKLKRLHSIMKLDQKSKVKKKPHENKNKNKGKDLPAASWWFEAP
jgi:hypothetical protein